MISSSAPSKDSVPMREASQFTNFLRKKSLFFGLLPAIVYLIILYIIPIIRTLRLSLFDPSFTWEHYIHFFKSPIYLDRLLFSLKVSLFVTVLCIVLGYPIAYLLSFTSPKVKALLIALILIPFWSSTLVRNYAWMSLLGRNGFINNTLISLGLISEPLKLLHTLFAVLVGMCNVLLPYTILPMFSVMSSIDKNLLTAGRSLGGSPIKVFFRIFFPLSLPGVAGGGLLVFIMGLGYYITPALLGGTSEMMISNLIDTQISSLLNWGFGSALSGIPSRCHVSVILYI